MTSTRNFCESLCQFWPILCQTTQLEESFNMVPTSLANSPPFVGASLFNCSFNSDLQSNSGDAWGKDYESLTYSLQTSIWHIYCICLVIVKNPMCVNDYPPHWHTFQDTTEGGTNLESWTKYTPKLILERRSWIWR